MNLVRVARATVAGATAREESRGAHTRTDHPQRSEQLLGRFIVAGDASPQFVPLPEPALRNAS
jgi:succinate dehydrogenase/fumarate reductase flavoprotein subunit